MKKFHILALTLLAAFSACSDDDNNINNKSDNYKIKLIASKTEIEPFEDIKVSIDVDFKILQENYDSIRWKANGTAYSFFGSPWFNIDDDRDLRITDYREGKHKAYAFGYKNGIIKSVDSIEYIVKRPTGNFINIRWNRSEINEYLNYTTGQTPIKYYSKDDSHEKFGGVSLTLDHWVENLNREYVKLQFIPWGVSRSKTIEIPNINDFDWNKFVFDDSYKLDRTDENTLKYNFFHSYLIDLYGAPKFIYEGDDTTQSPLGKEYTDRFDYNKKEEYFYPVEIWDTPTSYIAILRCNNPIGIGYKKGPCYVIAQPRK